MKLTISTRMYMVYMYVFDLFSLWFVIFPNIVKSIIFRPKSSSILSVILELPDWYRIVQCYISCNHFSIQMKRQFVLNVRQLSSLWHFCSSSLKINWFVLQPSADFKWKIFLSKYDIKLIFQTQKSCQTRPGRPMSLKAAAGGVKNLFVIVFRWTKLFMDARLLW